MASGDWLEARLGKLYDDGTELELLGGQNFIGFTIEADLVNGRYNITNPSGALTGTDGTIVVDGSDLSVGDLVAGNYVANTIPIVSLANASAQFRWLARNSSGAGAWEEMTRAQLVAAIYNQFGHITMAGDLLGCYSINGAQLAVPVEGTGLTNADQTITVAGGNDYTQATALTADRTKTLGTTGSPLTGEVITIKRHVTSAFTMPIVNGGAGAGTIFTFPASLRGVADFRFDGTNWEFMGYKKIVSNL